MFRIHDILVWIRIQIRRSMPLTNGSGSCYFCHWPSRCQQKTNFLTQFFLLSYFLKVHLHYFSKIKSQKELQNSRVQGFSYYFCMMIEGSGSRAGSGSIPLISGSGSGRPKNTWLRWIRIRWIRIRWIGIRIRNTDKKVWQQIVFTPLFCCCFWIWDPGWVKIRIRDPR
jgi:hypothetical protein